MADSSERFSRAVVTTLAKRAANRCSNPQCGAITSGPSNEPTDSINVGEAAHIFGAKLGSARHDPQMAPSARSDISNSIWLCATCHKLVDDDPGQYPAGLLFEWQREHERKIAAQIGKTAAEIRERYERRHLEELGHLSYRAERLVLEKGRAWEYRLTAEVLRFELAPVFQRWRALKQGLYIKSRQKIQNVEAFSWISNRASEAKLISQAFSKLTNEEFHRAWGEPGTPGDETQIVVTCRLFREMCESALAWEEEVRFASFDNAFDDLQALYVGAVGRVIDEAEKLPRFLSDTFGDVVEPGNYELKLNLDLPEGWGDDVERALEHASIMIAAEM